MKTLSLLFIANEVDGKVYFRRQIEADSLIELINKFILVEQELITIWDEQKKSEINYLRYKNDDDIPF